MCDTFEPVAGAKPEQKLPGTHDAGSIRQEQRSSNEHATAPSYHRAKPRVVRNVIKGCLGNLIEWYDWFVYASFSIYFAAEFFLTGNATVQLLSTAAVFAVGFLMRPLGGWLLGMYADRHGRRNALALSVLLMSGGSLAIGLTPSFEAIGMLAPIILVIARLLQGLSVGGEFGSSATYLSEVATPGRRGFFSSFQYVSIIIGQLSALVVMILRRTMGESEHYKIEKAREAAGLENGAKPVGSLRALMQYPKQLVAVFALAIGGTVSFYVFTTYMQKYMVNTSGIAKEDPSVISFFALLIFMFLQPIAGAVSDRIGRRKIMLFFPSAAHPHHRPRHDSPGRNHQRLGGLRHDDGGPRVRLRLHGMRSHRQGGNVPHPSARPGRRPPPCPGRRNLWRYGGADCPGAEGSRDGIHVLLVRNRLHRLDAGGRNHGQGPIQELHPGS